jgi:hypothetical protein
LKSADVGLRRIHQGDQHIDHIRIKRARDVGGRGIRWRRRVRMINRQMFPAVRFDFAERIEERVRLGVVFGARFRRNVGEWKNLERAIIFAGDDTAGFVWRIVLRLRNELGQLLKSDLHTFKF